MRLLSAILARNEAGPDRYLRRVIARCQSFSDTVLLLDDGSTDDTRTVARDLGCVVIPRTSAPAWGQEASARQELWEAGLDVLGDDPDGWLLICDADQELVGDIRGLCRSKEVNTWSFVLLDCWSPTEFRVDGHWQAHRVPRPWLFAPQRVPPNWTAEWSSRGIHPGHCPTNWPMMSGIAPPDDYHWLHWGWSNPAHRRAKYEQYAAQAHQLSVAERAHLESVLT